LKLIFNIIGQFIGLLQLLEFHSKQNPIIAIIVHQYCNYWFLQWWRQQLIAIFISLGALTTEISLLAWTSVLTVFVPITAKKAQVE